MPNQDTNPADDTDEETTEYTIYGWANLAPSCTIEIPADESIEDITTSDRVDALREELERLGFDPDRFSIEIHEVVESF
jgi:hypothetical protein